MSKQIIVDGANVAYGTSDKPTLENVEQVVNKLKEKGFEPVVIFDAAIRYDIEKQEEFEKLLDKEGYKQAPAETDADYFIINHAKEFGAKIVTNDRYQDFEGDKEYIDKNRVPFMIVDGTVELHKLPNNKNNGTPH